MEKVKEIVLKFPDTTEVSLERTGIYSLEELLNELSKLRNLRVLRLANNELDHLPADMSSLQKVEYLDLRNNNFKDLQSLMSGLFSLPSLKHLYINLDEKDEDEIIISLSNLLSFNGTPLTDLPDNDFPTIEPEIFLSPINKLQNKHEKEQNTEEGQFAMKTQTKEKEDTITVDLSLESFPDARKLYEAVCLYTSENGDFETFSEVVLKELHQLINPKTDKLKLQAEILNAKKVLFDSSVDGFISKIAENDKKAASVLMIVKNTYSDLCDQYYTLNKQVHVDTSARVSILRSELEKVNKELITLRESSENLRVSYNESEKVRKRIAIDAETEREKLTEEIGYLKTEIEKYKNRLQQFQLNRQRIVSQVNTSPRQFLQHSVRQKSELKSPSKMKPLSLKQLKEIIDEIYSSKVKFDQKCRESNLPRETMEQHLYTFLNQKYGLKPLIYDWATTITHALKKFAKEDNDVNTFGKILRNEIDEEFRLVQKQLKQTVAELLKAFLKGKFSRKLESEISGIIHQKLNGELNEEEWVDIIKYMYNNEDSIAVIIKVNDVIRENQLISGKAKNSSFDAEKGNKVPYRLFVEVLLDFQLEAHEKFLSRYIKIFREIDSNRDGILTDQEFKQLVLRLEPSKSEEEIENWWHLIDPNNHKQITFTESVTYLSADLIKMMNKSRQSTSNLCSSETLDGLNSSI
ncbi:hypothetical protein ABK040_008818 [Willaertia magna]